MRKTGKDFYVILIGRVFQAIFALVSVRLTTTLLGPTQMGRMNLISSITAWFGFLLISPVGNYVTRQAIEWNAEGRLIQSIKRYIILLIIAAVGEMLVLLIVYFTVGIGTPILLNWLVGLVITSLILGSLNTIFITLINTLGYRGWYVLFANLTAWLGLGTAVVLAYWLGNKAEFWMTGLLLGQIIIMIFAGIVLYRVANQIPKETNGFQMTTSFNIASIFKFSWPLIIATGFYWIQNSGYRFILVFLKDETTIGLFVAGLAIAMSPMVMFDNLFTEYYRPIFYQDIAFSNKVQQSRAWNRYADAYFPAIILLAVYMALGGPFLARILVSEEFQKVSWLAYWGAAIEGALMVYATYVYLVFASLDTRILIWPNIFGAFVAFIGIWILVPWQPLLGTSIALTLGMFTTMIDLARRLKHIFILELPWRRIIYSILLAIPMSILLIETRKIWPQPTSIQAIFSLSIAGGYILGAQFLLARKWLFIRSKPTLAQISIETFQ